MEDNRMVSFSLGGMAFEYDDNKNQINIKKHGISFKSAARIFFDYDRIEFYDEDRGMNSKKKCSTYTLSARSHWGLTEVMRPLSTSSQSIRSHPAGHEKSAGAGISGKSEAEVPENILNGQDPLRGRTLPAAGLFQKKRRFLVRSGKITTFLCFCNKCLLINYPSPVLAIHTLFVYNKDVRGSSQCAAPDEEQNSIPNEKNLRGVCYHGFR